MISLHKATVAQLKKLPVRRWDTTSIYKSLCIINSRRKHDSGYALMYIIGVNDKYEAVEIAAVCDDIGWETDISTFRTDMLYPSGIIHIWSFNCKFEVGASLSSTAVSILTENKKLANLF